ncbi:sensor histidine kinase [Halomonas salifodinae]|uniref:histidine kinase n=1 Tax=Halomonas salifodinae TaxID=438745 RepID=A0ABW2F3F1_9GAMM
MRLRNLIIATVLTPLFLVLLVVSLVAIVSLEDNLRTKLQSEVQVLSQAIGTSLGYALTQEAPREALQESLHAAFSFHRIYGAYVFDTRGNKIYGLGLGETLFDPEEIRAVADSGEELGAYRRHERWSYYSALVPLTTPGGEPRGVLQVNRLNTGVENYIGFLSLVVLGGFVIAAVGIVALIWWGFRRHIERPLERLLEVMERVGGGERQRRASLEGPDEYRRLSLALNGMLDALAAKDADIEARRRKEIALERRLRKSKKLAELGVLAAGVAHELGAPLSVIDGQAQRLERRATDEDEQRRLTRIRGEVARIVGIVRQLMDLGRRHNLEVAPCRLDDLVQGALALVEGGDGIEVRLPEPPPTLRADEQQLTQVLTNLLQNARQASPEGRVRLSARVIDAELCLRVEDDGPGIPDEHQGRVFDPFFTTKPAGQGSGLGLAMAHRIVSDHGGSITLGDTDLGGAAFEVTLPLDNETRPMGQEA